MHCHTITGQLQATDKRTDFKLLIQSSPDFNSIALNKMFPEYYQDTDIYFVTSSAIWLMKGKEREQVKSVLLQLKII